MINKDEIEIAFSLVLTSLMLLLLIAAIAGIGCVLADRFVNWRARKKEKAEKHESKEGKGMCEENVKKVKKVFFVHGDLVGEDGERLVYVFGNRRDAMALAWGVLGVTGQRVTVHELAVPECSDEKLTFDIR